MSSAGGSSLNGSLSTAASSLGGSAAGSGRCSGSGAAETIELIPRGIPWVEGKSIAVDSGMAYLSGEATVRYPPVTTLPSSRPPICPRAAYGSTTNLQPHQGIGRASPSHPSSAASHSMTPLTTPRGATMAYPSLSEWASENAAMVGNAGAMDQHTGDRGGMLKMPEALRMHVQERRRLLQQSQAL